VSTVAVTGNLGYIGPVVVRALRARGHRVIGIDRGWYTSQHATMPDWPDVQRFGDLSLGAEYLPNVVVHLAGLSNDPLSEFAPELTHQINEVGTLSLVRAMKKVRHVVISSCAVYGASEDVATEESPVNPLTAYARAKANVDAALDGQPNVMILRLGTVYGPSPGHRLDLVVNRMAYDAVHGLGVKVHGSSWRPFTHIEDVAEAIARAVESNATGIHNVVGQNLRIDTLGEMVGRATGARVLSTDSPDARNYRAATVRGPWMDYRHTVADTIPELAAFSLTLPGLPSRYERLATLKHLVASGRLTPDLEAVAA
jgi:nucleoside-diphosphate-sugar epimerase